MTHTVGWLQGIVMGSPNPSSFTTTAHSLRSTCYVAVGYSGTFVYTCEPSSSYFWISRQNHIGSYNYFFAIYGGNYTWVIGGSSGRLMTSENGVVERYVRNSGVSATLFGLTVKE